jgi:hypothetical protein
MSHLDSQKDWLIRTVHIVSCGVHSWGQHPKLLLAALVRNRISCVVGRKEGKESAYKEHLMRTYKLLFRK